MSALRKSSSEFNARLPSGRCSFDDLAIIKANAKAAGLSVSEYMRRACIGVKIEPRLSQSDLETIEHLRRIGVNLNQQTRALHARGRHVPKQLEHTLEKIETVLEGLRYGSANCEEGA